MYLMTSKESFYVGDEGMKIVGFDTHYTAATRWTVFSDSRTEGTKLPF